LTKRKVGERITPPGKRKVTVDVLTEMWHSSSVWSESRDIRRAVLDRYNEMCTRLRQVELETDAGRLKESHLS